MSFLIAGTNRPYFSGSLPTLRATHACSILARTCPGSVAGLRHLVRMRTVLKHTLNFYPLGNADSCLIELAEDRPLLFDFADTRTDDDPDDLRIDLARVIRDRLDALGRDSVEVLALSHLDEDHIMGVSEFFYLEHAKKYQGADRVKIEDLWVPAAAITESKDNLSSEGRIVQGEARHRLKQGDGIRVFSRPDALEDWLADHGLTVSSREHLITDAGQLIPGFSKEADGVEFFSHSPFADREDGKLVDRNAKSLVLQATFLSGRQETRVILSGDAPHEELSRIVRVTKGHSNEGRLEWDVFKVPHHCSYLSLGPEKGAETTEPVPDVAWLFEEQGARRSILVSSSDPIPDGDTDQPPHRQAAAYYRRIADDLDGEFKVTMEHPSVSAPEPLIINIDQLGGTIRKRAASSSDALIQRPSHRAG